MPGERTRIVIHLSDLHFGREDRRVVAALGDAVRAIGPDVVAVSGDLTQRARRSQFLRARAFLDALPFPRIVVPGNHDVPLFNLLARALDPLGGYRRYLTADLEPAYVDDVVWVGGIDTTRPETWKSGGVRSSVLARVRQAVRAAGNDVVRILVAHHPFNAPEQPGTDGALTALTEAGIDAFLTGHLHASYTGHTAHRYRVEGRAAVVVEAGTATSTRLRDENNAFNVLRVERSAIVVDRCVWTGVRFDTVDTQQFRRSADGWAGD